MAISKRKAFPALLILLTLLLASCGLAGGQEAQEGSDKKPGEAAGAIEDIKVPKGTEIDFWHIQATIYGESVAAVVDEFNATNEWGIVVNQLFKGSYLELNQAIRAGLAGGGAPDVAMAYENDILEYQRAGEVVELDSYLESEKYGLTDEEMADILPGVLARQQVPAYGGATLSWPHGNSSLGMYYNADLLAEAGIDSPPTTHDEFLAQARQLKEATGGKYVALSQAMNSVYYNLLRDKGVAGYDPKTATTDFGSPESIEVLSLLETLYKEKLAYTVFDGVATEAEFINGRSPIELGTTARSSSKIEAIGSNFNWGIAALGDDGPAITQLFGGNHVMIEAGGNDKEHLAAWLFMRYFASTTAQSVYAADTGYSPAVRSALETVLLQNDYTESPQKQQAFDEVFVNAEIMPPTSAGNAINDMVSKEVVRVTLGQATPEEAAERMDAEATSLLEAAKP